MIRFFRQLRQRLLAENRVSRYFLYAIGEIVLVMVGILLALQVNNWNEARKTKQLEKSTLLEIYNALMAEHAELEKWISIRQLQDSNITRILNYLEDKEPYSEKLNKSWQSGFLRPLYSFNTSPYELLKSRGFDIIDSDTLRKDLQHHYDVSIPNMIDYLERNYELMDSFRSEYLRHLRIKEEGFQFAPSNIETFRSEAMLNGLSMLGFWHKNSQEWMADLKTETEALSVNISKYLNQQ